MDRIKNIPTISAENIEMLFDGEYLRFTDLQYAPGKHYYNATRRTKENLAAIKSDKEFQNMLADAVSCVVILDIKNEEPKLLLSYEYRYPAGRFLLSVPAGLVDKEDKTKDNPLAVTAVREIKEETGLNVKDNDMVTIINPFLFSSPGMSDEGNALVCAILHPDDLSGLSQSGAEGTELFNGFTLLAEADAKKILNNGRDEYGNFYSMYTWAALTYFVSGMWKNNQQNAERGSM